MVKASKKVSTTQGKPSLIGGVSGCTSFSSEVYMMDCIQGMKEYPDKYFDLAVVDPPYRDKNSPTKEMRQ